MLNCIIRLLYLKQLYFSVGKSIISESYSYCSRYINYNYFEEQYSFISKNKSNEVIYFNDKYNAFFSLLMYKLIENIYCENDVICIMSPFFNQNVIDYIFIPSKNLHIYNISLEPYDEKMYLQSKLFEFEDYNIDLAYSFFEKSTKNIIGF